MKASDLIKIISEASDLYSKKFKLPLEIFSIDFDQQDRDGVEGMVIEACSRVDYDYDEFGSSKTGSRPCCDIRVDINCENKKISKWFIKLEDIRK